MAITILNAQHSFVKFNEPAPDPYCIWGSVDYCLPIYLQSDVQFQFGIQGTEEEIDALCLQDATEVQISLVADCGDEPLITFPEKPNRYRLSLTQIVYNWEHGLPNYSSVIAVNQCFKIQAQVGETTFCSNCFERIADDCFTSVIEYGNDEDVFGFKYCYGGDFGSDVDNACEPTIIQFINQATINIPYTAMLQSKYGGFPTVQAWIYDGMGQLVSMGITITFDGYPPTAINLDFGGPSTGIVVIR